MATIEVGPTGKLHVSPTAREEALIEDIKFGGNWTPKGYYVFPPDPRVVESLQATGMQLLISDTALQWYRHVVKEERIFARLATGTGKQYSPDYPLWSKLWEHQRVAVTAMLYKKRALLCDDMGLGKTVTAIAATSCVPLAERVLVICKRLATYWWEDAWHAWGTGGQVNIWEPFITRSTDARALPAGVNIVSWEALRVWNTVGSVNWDVVIVDEAHKAKNRNSVGFKALQRIFSRYMFLLTGTPNPNNPSELWPLLHLTDRKRYPSYWGFVNTHCEVDPHYGAIKSGIVRANEALQLSLRGTMIRRLKTEVLDLPDKHPLTWRLPMAPSQQRAYRQLTKEYAIFDDSGKFVVGITNPLALFQKQLQLAISPSLLSTDLGCDSPKLAALRQILDACAEAGEKVIVYSQFRAGAKLAAETAHKAGYKVYLVMGGSANPTDLVTFTEIEPPCAICATVATLAESVTILDKRKPGMTIVYMDLHPDVVLMQHSVDRVHRIGQEGLVTVHYLLCKGTVDHRVEELLAAKLSMSGKILDHVMLEHAKEVLE